MINLGNTIQNVRIKVEYTDIIHDPIKKNFNISLLCFYG